MITAPPDYPARLHSSTAEVLALLLEGREITGLDALAAASTTRLAAIVHALRKNYGWPIEAEHRAMSCLDGRTATVAAYRLPPDVIDRANAAGWCAAVHAARAELRARRNAPVEAIHA